MSGQDRTPVPPQETGGQSKGPANKRGTPNKRWKNEYDAFLIPLLVEQAKKGLKCDKSFKRVAFSFAAIAVNARFGTDFTPENVENHYRTLKARFAEIKKIRDLSGAGWDEETKTITLDPTVALTYTEAHPAARPFINRPIEHYEGLRIICGDDSATGSYAASIFSDFADKSDNEPDEDMNPELGPMEQQGEEDGDAESIPPVARSAATSSTQPAQRASKSSRNASMVMELVNAVDKMAAAIQNPTHWTESLHKKVMEVDGFDEDVLLDVFDYLEEHENEARRFMARKLDHRKAWVQKFMNGGH